VDLAKPVSWLSIVANIGLLTGMGLVAYEINQNSRLARMALVNEGNLASPGKYPGHHRYHEMSQHYGPV